MPAQILINDYSTQKLFLRNQYFTNAVYTNSTGNPVTLTAGRLMGRILATNKVLPQASTSTDGSEMPRFVLADDYVVADGDSVTVSLCFKGDVNQLAISLTGAETLDTVVRTVSTGGGTIGDLLRANSEIVLIPSTELSTYDNPNNP